MCISFIRYIFCCCNVIIPQFAQTHNQNSIHNHILFCISCVCVCQSFLPLFVCVCVFQFHRHLIIVQLFSSTITIFGTKNIRTAQLTAQIKHFLLLEFKYGTSCISVATWLWIHTEQFTEYARVWINTSDQLNNHSQ